MHNGKIFKENICQKQKKQKGNVLQGSKSWDEGAHSIQSVGDKLKCLQEWAGDVNGHWVPGTRLSGTHYGMV